MAHLSDSKPGARHSDQQTGPAKDCGTGNIRGLLQPRRTLTLAACALGTGLLLSAAFPPLEWDLVVWLALLPMLLCPVPATLRGRCLTGYIVGYTHAVTSLSWLNEVGFGAGYLLSVYCALYPMLWYLLAIECSRLLSGSRDMGPRWSIAGSCRGLRQIGAVLSLAAVWVALEWIRGWMFSGFPWNALGISQWRHTGLLTLTTVTGVPGLSFLIVATNAGMAMAARDRWDTVASQRRRRHAVSWGLGTVAALLLVAWAVILSAPRIAPPVGSFRVLAVQGNIPQCRIWSDAQFEEAVDVYCSLTSLMTPAAKPDLVVWPESAIPAPVGYKPYKQRLDALMAEIQTPLLIGALDSRTVPGATWTGEDWSPPAEDFNAAILFDDQGKAVDVYDKIHRVPFGEYVPFARYMPWLVDLIGMGRGLVAGREHTVMDLGRGVRAGVNICFEDVFPGISRGFVRRQANVLFTLTNDAWYAESAGSRQHMIHAVFRAAETRRPLLRSGNNSDTCLIFPDGRVTDLLYDRPRGTRFMRGTQVYDVPIHKDPPMTFYSTYGDWFSVLCAVVFLLLGGVLIQQALQRKSHVRRAIRPDEVHL